MKSNKRIVFAGSVLYALIAGCTSHMDSDVDPVLTDGTPNAGGIYKGTIQQNGSPSSVPVIGIFSSSQRYVVYTTDLTSMYLGLYSVIGNGITSTNAQAYSLGTGANVGTVSFQGTFETQSAISAGYTFTASAPGATDSSGTLDLPLFQLSYKTPSATKDLEGDWDDHDSSITFNTSFTILGDGTVTTGHSNTTGCNYTGKINTINVMYNVYKVTLSESCPGSSTATTLVGLGSILPADTSSSTTQLVMAVGSNAEGRLFIVRPAAP